MESEQHASAAWAAKLWWCTHLVYDFQQLPILQHRRRWALLWPSARGEALRTAARLGGRRNGVYSVNSCTSAGNKPGALH